MTTSTRENHEFRLVGDSALSIGRDGKGLAISKIYHGDETGICEASGYSFIDI